ncbi:MAG TPA: efflux RND transporter periplasmic adaptor subunit [Steroidobacteraceae bacterium]|nr:efflux RND transporter periplasmic adaptor subunit [Steroidobacteraceae bacterium]
MNTPMDTATHTDTLESEQSSDPLSLDPSPKRNWLKWGLIALVVLIAVVWIAKHRGPEKTQYITQEVTRGDLSVTVTATGNLEPRNQVDIGSELSGTIRDVNVDVNDEVKEGQILATLDTTRLKAQVLQAQSSLASAQARAVQAQANEKQARANYARLQKVRELSGNKLPSQQDLDVAEATLAQAEGEIAAANASVEQARANLDAVRTDLSKTNIRSPVNGVVLVRSVEPGQTVAASLQAPVLFTLAEDLKKMELHVAVDEADVGSVQEGQKATFTVDAFPNRSFTAHITQVHFASNNTQKSTSSGASSASSATSTGVVTYETVLEVDNSELLLRPGMTATAEILTTSINDAILIPNAALRFTPQGAELPGAPNASQSRGPLSAMMPRFRRPGNNQQGGPRGIGRAWVLENGKPALALFHTGATDGRMTQVLPLGENANVGRMAANSEEVEKARARKLEPGTAVIVDEQTPQKP